MYFSKGSLPGAGSGHRAMFQKSLTASGRYEGRSSGPRAINITEATEVATPVVKEPPQAMEASDEGVERDLRQGSCPEEFQ